MCDLPGDPEVTPYRRWAEAAPTAELRRHAEAALRRAQATMVLDRLNQRNLAPPACRRG